MKTREKLFGFQQKLLVLAMLAAFGPAHADEGLDKLIKPDTASVSAGVAVEMGSQKDRSIMGQYNGWSDTSSALLLDFDYVQRNDETGSWTTAEGRNLGLDNRELRFSRDTQGHWKFYGEINEQVRHDPHTLNSGMTGVGSATPAVNTLAVVGAGAENSFNIKRRSYTLGGDFRVNSGLTLEGNLKSESKSGAVRSGIGNYCGPVIAGYRCATNAGALLALALPVNSTTLQVEAKANWTGSDYGVTVGYYSSSFTNDLGSVRLGSINGNLVDLAGAAVVPGSGTNTLGDLLLQPVALAPDNQAHQFYVSGNYDFNSILHFTGLYSKTHATQNESFAAQGLTVGAGLPASLNAAVDTTVAQAGFTARPLPKMNVLGNVRYEDVSDATPKALYGVTYINPNNSSQKINSKAEVSYNFPDRIRGTLGIDYNWVKRNVPAVGSTDLVIPTGSLTSIREHTNEVTVRAELRLPLTEELNGSLAYLQSYRNGSHWINLGNTSAAYPQTYQPVRWADAYSVTGIFPSNMVDRRRDKVRGAVDWAASDKLSLQMALEQGFDDFSAPTTTGLHGGSMNSVAVDATYALNDTWKATGYVNYGEQIVNQNHSAGYIARIANTTSTAGVGVTGKFSSKLEVGADLSMMGDVTHYGLESGNSSAAGKLPDVSYHVLALKLFGKYALDSQSDIRFEVINQNLGWDEWTWASAGVPFAYSDNATVSMQPNQSVTYVGVKYVYKIK